MDKFGCCLTVIQFLTHICLSVADDLTKCKGKLIVDLATHLDQGCMKLSSTTNDHYYSHDCIVGVGLPWEPIIRIILYVL